MKTILHSTIAVLLLAMSTTAFAADETLLRRATDLPDISLVGQFVGSISNGIPNDSTDTLGIREVEMSFQGYLYPSIRADVFMSLEKEDTGEFAAHVEEAYVSFMDLGNGFGAKVGRKLAPIGKLNATHSETWAFVNRPAVLNNFGGEDGLKGQGASLDYVFPFTVFVQAEIGAWRAVSKPVLEVGVETPFALSNHFYTAKLTTSLPLSDQSEWELGISGATGSGPNYTVAADSTKLLGLHTVYRQWLDAYAKLQLQAEWFQLSRTQNGTGINRNGAYLYAGYQWDKYWSVGFLYNISDSGEQTNTLTKNYNLILTNKLTETTKIRAQYTYNPNEKTNEVWAQLIFGLGPHSHVLQ